MKTVTWIATICVILCSIPIAADQEQSGEPEYEMAEHQFVLLVRGEGWRPMGEREIVRLQEAHLAYLGRLYDERKAIIVGPLSRGGDLRGVVILDVGSVEKAERLMAEDPWVKAGRLDPEIHPWWAAKGILQKGSEFLHSETCYLGLFKRPENAPDYPPEKLKELQKGHLANINDMADTGDLVIAGPMGDDGVLRGILVFRDIDTEKITEMVARDPSVRAGRLRLELYPWSVPKGSLPER